MVRILFGIQNGYNSNQPQCIGESVDDDDDDDDDDDEEEEEDVSRAVTILVERVNVLYLMRAGGQIQWLHYTLRHLRISSLFDTGHVPGGIECPPREDFLLNPKTRLRVRVEGPQWLTLPFVIKTVSLYHCIAATQTGGVKGNGEVDQISACSRKNSLPMIQIIFLQICWNAGQHGQP